MRDILSLSLSIKIRLLIKIYDRRLSAWLDNLRWPFGEKLTIQLIQIVMMVIVAIGLMAAMAYAPR